MGITPEIKTVHFSNPMGEEVSLEVETFTWEKLDYVDVVKEAFKL
jgi:S-adenosylmethionine synthetase